MQETTFTQVRGSRELVTRAPAEVMAEIDKCQKALDATGNRDYRAALLGRLRTLEWVLSGADN